MRNHALYVSDMLTAIRSIEAFIVGMSFEVFAADDRTASAVVRKLEILGEAAKQVPLVIREKYPHLPWKEMAGMRDKLIHFYFGVDNHLVWQTITERLPTLKPELEALLADLQENSQ